MEEEGGRGERERHVGIMEVLLLLCEGEGQRRQVRPWGGGFWARKTTLGSGSGAASSAFVSSNSNWNGTQHPHTQRNTPIKKKVQQQPQLLLRWETATDQV